MKLLNFIKKNVLLVAAFATVIGFSAFKLTENQSVTLIENWYQVDANGVINPEPMLSPPSDSPTAECSTVKEVNTCALQIELDSNLPFPKTEEEARTDHHVINAAFSDYP